MAKLRKMLGNMDSVECVDLRALIETQSKGTLTAWAVSYAKEQYLPIYEAQCSEGPGFRDIIGQCEAHVDGNLKLADLKPFLKKGRELSAKVEHPIAQAAARAVATACATANTPTNAFGFLLYGAAAVAYAQHGLEADAETYDRAATAELQKALASLQKAAIPDEAKPAKIKWNC